VVSSVGNVHEGVLLAMDASSPTDVWAVGGEPTFGVKSALVLHGDGKRWRRVSVPFQVRVFAVAAMSEDDVWAIGARETDPVENRLIHWDGSTWEEDRPPGDVNFSSVDGSAPDDLWVVGTLWLDKGDVASPYLAHWDGARWTRFPAPALPANVALEDVAVHSSTAAWAVGNVLDDEYGEPMAPVVLRWDGDVWRSMPAPRPQGAFDYVGLDNVTLTGADDVWSHTGFVSEEILVHWDGDRWTREPAPFYSVTGLHAAGSSLWATGVRSTDGETGYLSTARLGDDGWVAAATAVATTPVDADNNEGAPGLVALSDRMAWAAGRDPVLYRACL
jgi:hypothetical protein